MLSKIRLLEHQSAALDLISVALAGMQAEDVVDQLKEVFGYLPRQEVDPGRPHGPPSAPDVKPPAEEGGDSGSGPSAETTSSRRKSPRLKRPAEDPQVPTPKRVKVEAGPPPTLKVKFPLTSPLCMGIKPISASLLHATGVDERFFSKKEGSIYYCDFIEQCKTFGIPYSEEVLRCSYSCESRPQLASHLRRIHLGCCLQCPLCPHRFFHGKPWSTHMSDVHPNQKAFWYSAPTTRSAVATTSKPQ